MVFEQFYLSCLAQASYLIGSEGIGAVVDPQRDVDQYLEAAAQHGLRIAHVIETHLHADFVSGHSELAERTAAQIYLGEGSGATFAHSSVRDGDEIAFGKCRLRFLQTPGHTAESVCVLITDLERATNSERRHASGPWAVLTGDTLFIGDVGRPDLSKSYRPEELAGLLYDSLHNKLLALPDDVAVYPAHGAGSMCGRNISPDRSSTIGRERQFNYALRPMTREQFVHMMTEDLPPRPEYFQRDVDLNRHGAVPLAELPRLRAIPGEETQRLQRAGATILDTRAGGTFCSGHIPGSVNIGLGGQFAAWAGTVVGLDQDLILVAEDTRAVEESQQRLARVGIERLAGFVEGGVAGWVRTGLPLEQTCQISAQELQASRNEDGGSVIPVPSILDVRRPAEWKQGRIPGAVHIPLDDLRRRIAELDGTRTVAVYCKSGYRSSIACSLLQAAGFQRVLNIQGGFDAWSGANLAVG
ncbi:MAG TPA: rhodanese-like domain-containing protein [Bryobacteraceae bacterium]|nr:rhodanese-like domain-containing protein [Bryobacteraceae bacterium]